jgi:hypothetical protein
MEWADQSKRELLLVGLTADALDPQESSHSLAAITGWDQRFDAERRPRNVDDVARRYATECAR